MQNKGLTAQEAQKQQQIHGKNVIEGKKKTSVLHKLLMQFTDFSVLILLAAAVLSFAISWWERTNEYGEAVIIVCVLIINAIFGVVQETKAEHAIDALKKLSSPRARVIRDGEEKNIPASEVTVGDVLLIEAGEYISADGEILSCVALKTDETALTGESEPVIKEKGEAVFAGTVAVNGSGILTVTHIGMKTKIGQIAMLLNTHKESMTPLQKRLDRTGKVLGMGALVICALVFLLGLLAKMDVLTIFMTSVSLAVAAIPEGLPATVTVVLAMGVTKMAKRRAIVRKLPAVETLGSVSVICSDKTGTLTENAMRVVKTEGEERRALLTKAAICSHAEKDSGDPTEQALMRALEASFRRPAFIKEIPFDSVRKRMSVAVRTEGLYHIIVKGAPEFVLPLCTQLCTKETTVPMTKNAKDRILQQADAMAKEGLRVLAVADKKEKTINDMETELVFCGLIAMRDPLREGVKEAISACKNAGIRTVMITGDHPATASAIARDAGITPVVMTGAEIEKADSVSLAEKIKTVNVFARVTPEHKMKLIEAYRATGAVVAMTGDGVNDAPALRAADIGVAMGKGGTEVAREAADMILTDDNFTTIVEAVRQGRGVYANIQKAVRFLLSSNIGELLTIFVALLFHWPAPLVAVQLLWVNLVTDSLPAIALGLEPVEENVLSYPPIRREESMFSHGVGARIITEGLLIGAVALVTYYSAFMVYGYEAASTMTFLVLSLSQLVHAFTVRSEKPLYKAGWNPYLLLAFFVCVLLQICVVLLPILNRLFHVVPLSAVQWGYVAGMALLPFLVAEIEKLLDRKK